MLNYKNNISNILKSDNFEIDKDFITNHIKDNRDKDLLISKEDFDFLVCCKYREIAKVDFNNIKKIFNVTSFYNLTSVIITNTNYSPKAQIVASNSNIILSYKNNLVEDLNLYIKRQLEEKELNILSKILYD